MLPSLSHTHTWDQDHFLRWYAPGQETGVEAGGPSGRIGPKRGPEGVGAGVGEGVAVGWGVSVGSGVIVGGNVGVANSDGSSAVERSYVISTCVLSVMSLKTMIVPSS